MRGGVGGTVDIFGWFESQIQQRSVFFLSSLTAEPTDQPDMLDKKSRTPWMLHSSMLVHEQELADHMVALNWTRWIAVFWELGLSPKFTSKFSQLLKTAKFTQGELGKICSKGVQLSGGGASGTGAISRKFAGEIGWIRANLPTYDYMLIYLPFAPFYSFGMTAASWVGRLRMTKDIPFLLRSLRLVSKNVK